MAAPMTASVPGAAANPPAQSGPLLAAWAAYKAGFRGQSLLTAVAISGAESSYNPNSLNNNPSTGDYSVGLWQINYFGNLAQGRTRQFGPPSSLLGVNGALANANAAFAVSGGGRNFQPWTTYTSGAYQAHAAEAAQAVQQVTGGDIGTGPTAAGTGTTAAQLTSTSTSGPGGLTYDEKCLFKAPSATVPVIGTTLGGNCFFGTSQARAVAGAGLIGVGVILSMAGFAIVTASLLGKPISTAVSFVPGPVGKVAGAVGNATGRDRTRQRERPDREPPLGEQDISDLDQGLTAKRQEAEGPSEGELEFRRESQARRRASRPRRAA